ncbi:hypothetical protein P280DRAFT_430375, partial [Massarina eburnea CBS 473.64]
MSTTMAPKLGKRKRVTREELERSRSPSPSASESDSEHSDGEDVEALFRKAFEAKFKPLDIEPVQKKVKEEESEDEEEEELEEDSDWSGISSEDEEGKVEVFDYATDSRQLSDKASKAEMRAFMSSKPPTSSSTTLSKPTSKSSKPADESDPTEASHLKNDLALQSLLRESQLLSKHNPTYSTRGDNPSTKSTSIATRHKLVDMHMQTLGAKGSVYTQKKMPMAARKGIVAKENMREETRRKEAKENGIILERENRGGKAGSGSSRGKRDGGVGAPSVGKFRNGTLTLSKKDVASITREGGGRGGRRGRGKRGKR